MTSDDLELILEGLDSSNPVSPIAPPPSASAIAPPLSWGGDGAWGLLPTTATAPPSAPLGAVDLAHGSHGQMVACSTVGPEGLGLGGVQEAGQGGAGGGREAGRGVDSLQLIAQRVVAQVLVEPRTSLQVTVGSAHWSFSIANTVGSCL